MECIPAENNDIRTILCVLCEAQKVPSSENFLDNFPFDSIKWFECDLKGTDLGELYLFWDGKAWGRNGNVLPRTLRAGVKDFRQIADKHNQENPPHLERIIEYMKKNKKAGNSLRGSGTSPILVSIDEYHPLLILDGNHRLVTYWWKNSNTNQNTIDKTFWVGFSQNMKKYKYYDRIL